MFLPFVRIYYKHDNICVTVAYYVQIRCYCCCFAHTYKPQQHEMILSNKIRSNTIKCISTVHNLNDRAGRADMVP